MMMLQRCLILLAALAAVAPAAAFAPPSAAQASATTTTTTRDAGTALFGNTKVAPSLPEIKDISYGEEARPYRRTVFSHDDWRRFRSPDRFFYYVASMTSSGVYKGVGREVLATTAIATFVVLYNCAVGGYADFSGVKHDALISSQWLPLLGLPLAPFTLSSPSLGLLLGELRFFDGDGVTYLPERATFPNCGHLTTQLYSLI